MPGSCVPENEVNDHLPPLFPPPPGQRHLSGVGEALPAPAPSPQLQNTSLDGGQSLPAEMPGARRVQAGQTHGEVGTTPVPSGKEGRHLGEGHGPASKRPRRKLCLLCLCFQDLQPALLVRKTGFS